MSFTVHPSTVDPADRRAYELVRDQDRQEREDRRREAEQDDRFERKGSARTQHGT